MNTELYCEIIYRRSTHSWMVRGYVPYEHSVTVCGYGSLRRARRHAREWLREHGSTTVFETIRPETQEL